MVLPPGWNISEPVALVAKLHSLVILLQSASADAQSFSWKVEALERNLNELQKKLNNCIPGRSADLEYLRTTLVHCQTTVERCQQFHEQFKRESWQAARWIWRRETATRLGQEIDSQNDEILLALQIYGFDGRGLHGSLDLTSADITTTAITSSASGTTNSPTQMKSPHVRTAADLLGIRQWDFTGESVFGAPFIQEPEPASPLDNPVVAPYITELPSYASSVNSNYVTPMFSQPTSRQSSSTGTFSPDSRRSCRLHLGSPSPELTMNDLSGVQISYYRGNHRVSYPLSKIEFVKDYEGKIEWIISTTDASLNLKLYQHVSPSRRFIPHNEHPVAYGHKQTFRVKFLTPHLLSSEKLSCSPDYSPEQSATLRPNRELGTPNTVASSESMVGRRSTASSVPSSIIRNFHKEAERQEYDFTHADGYTKFQERIMGKRLLLNTPVSQIDFKRREHSKARRECSEQYLRLWETLIHQSILFYADESDVYKEYNIEFFRPDNAKSSSHELKLDVHIPGIEAPRRRSSGISWRSKLSSLTSPTSPGKGKQKEPATSVDHDRIPEELKGLDYLTIRFSYARDREAFLENAKFYGLPNASMLPSFTFPSSDPNIGHQVQEKTVLVESRYPAHDDGMTQGKTHKLSRFSSPLKISGDILPRAPPPQGGKIRSGPQPSREPLNDNILPRMPSPQDGEIRSSPQPSREPPNSDQAPPPQGGKIRSSPQPSTKPLNSDQTPLEYATHAISTLKLMNLNEYVSLVKEGRSFSFKEVPEERLKPGSLVRLPPSVDDELAGYRNRIRAPAPLSSLELISLEGYEILPLTLSVADECFVAHKLGKPPRCFRQTTGPLRPPHRKAWFRVRYRCICGEEAYDEFGSKAAAVRCASLMKTSTEGHCKPHGNIFHRAFQSIGTGISEAIHGRPHTPSLPTNKSQLQVEHESRSTSSTPTELLFLLMCINYRKWTPTLVQENACNIHGDKELFNILRQKYHDSCGKVPTWLRLRSLKALKFIQFEIFKNDLVSVTKAPSLPPPEMKAEYRPCYSACDIPMGENLILHYLHHPDHADDAPVWFERIPKKLHERLFIDPERRTNIGWGMQLIEGLDYTKLCVIGLISLSISIVFGVVWSVLRHDVQGGFGVTASLMMFFTFTVGSIQAAAVS